MPNEVSAIVYDIEIRRCIPDTRNPAAASEINPVTGSPYEFCDGWTDYKGMKIGVLCAWDCVTNRPLVYDESNIEEFQNLIQQRQIVTGFNIHKFDNNICAAYGLEIEKWKVFDLYREALIACGVDPDKPTRGGRNLNEFARVNLGTKKREDGADAPKMFQRGEMPRLYTYCLDDVMIERALFERARRGKLIDPVTGNVLKLNVPDAIKITEAV
jgi:hypothetical protein